MNNSLIMSRKHFRLYILLFLLIDFSTGFGQTNWDVPADKKKKLSPYEFNDSIRRHGKEIYENNCKSCHGNPGKSDYQKLTPHPPDPAGSTMQDNTDGEMFYKITTGKMLMPSFKEILTPKDIWSVIAYIRSFNNGYVQEVEKVVNNTGYSGTVRIFLSQPDTLNKIKAVVLGENKNKIEPLANVEVKLFVKRYFGSLPVDEVKTTNDSGIVEFNAPKILPGDSIGMLHFTAMLTNQELYGSVKADTALEMGVPTNKPSLRAKRAMWNTMNKAPYWILITYFGGLLAVWGTLFYILFQLRKIFFIGKNEANPN